MTDLLQDDDEVAEERKLIPEWGVRADDQIVAVGLAALVALVAFFGLGRWWLGETAPDAVTASAPVGVPDGGEQREVGDSGVTTTIAAAPATSGPAAPSTVTSVDPPTTSAGAAAGVGREAVQRVLDTLPGVVVGTVDGTVVVLDGYVADESESTEAERTAAAVAGVTSVDNRLALIQPAVLDRLIGAGVVEAAVDGVGTAVVVRGVLADEAQRLTVIEAVRILPGVTSVDDQLTVSVAADLNQLPQVQFRTGSAEILAVSHPDLDRAAQLLMAAGEVTVQIEGYTDVTGGDEVNRQLSTDRANAVLEYLVAAGVDPARLTAEGFGETREFAPGDDPDSLAMNRVVRFRQL